MWSFSQLAFLARAPPSTMFRIIHYNTHFQCGKLKNKLTYSGVYAFYFKLLKSLYMEKKFLVECYRKFR